MNLSEVIFRDDINVELIQSVGNDEIIARAARASSNKDKLEGVDPKRLVTALWREGHTVPFEHNLITLRIEMPLFLTPQMLKHRHTSISQLSGRYSKMPPQFYINPEDRPLSNDGSSMRPEMVDGGKELRDLAEELYVMAAETQVKAYNALLDAGASNEVARNVLPPTVYTTQWVSMNLHGWFNLLYLRNGSHGFPQWEWVKLSSQIEDIIAELFPYAFTAWKELG